MAESARAAPPAPPAGQGRAVADFADPKVPLEGDPLWADVTPIPQDEGPSPVTPIMYPPEFTETMNFFRAILQSGEVSERAFHLTTRAIKCNAANYTAWHFRRRCLVELNKDLDEELAFIEAQARVTAKNYQLWYHRRVVVERSGKATREFAFTASVFEEDAKNYHAWAHRQWVLKKFGEWEGELAVVDSMLKDDVRNNSAWNQRWFVIQNTTGFTPEVIEAEIDYAFDKIVEAISNESPWNYVRGLLRGQTPELFAHARKRLAALLADETTAEVAAVSVPLRAMQAELLIEEGNVAEADATFAALESLDETRSRYWQLRRSSLAE